MILVVDGQRIYNYEYQEPQPIATNSLGFIDIEFRLSEEWEGYICTAQFVQHKENGADFVASKVLYNNHVTFPDGIIPGVLEISLFGYKAGEAERGTTFPYIQPVCRSGFTSTEATPIPPTPDLYSQFLESFETTKQSIENDKQTVQNASKDAITARDYAVDAARSAKSSEQNAIKTLEAIKATSTDLIKGIETAGATQISNVQSEGATQISSVKDAGGEQLRALSAQGDVEQRKVIAAGDEQVSRVTNAGNGAVESVTLEKTNAINGVQSAKTEAVNSVETAKTSAVEAVKSAESAAIQNIGTGVDDTLSISGKAADAKKTGDSISSLKDDLDSFTYIERSPNLFNKDDANITSNAQIRSNGEVKVNSAWSSFVTDFIKINATGSKTLRQTLNTNIRIAEYKADGTFISITSINSSSPMTLNDETEKIRIEFWGTSGLMVYQSDTSLPYQDYYVNILVDEDAIPTTIARKNDVEIELALLDDRVSILEEYEITNYAMFVDTYKGKTYNSSGRLIDNADYNATSMCKFDRTRPIRPSNIGDGHAVFFDENKSYISTVNCYKDSPVGVSAYPENAVYVAFDYFAGSYSCGEWGTYWKDVTRNSSLQNVSLSHTKKRKGTRPVINIYTTDTQMEILAKLCDAFHTEDCDVVFERGEYTFDSVFVEMYEKGQRNYIELPIGGRCRYYFNGSTLTADQSVFNEAGYSGNISLFSCIYNLNSSESYELYDGTLIGKGITYVVHDECGGKPNWYSHRYKNMKFLYQTDSQTTYIRKPIGGGTGLFGESIFENCKFETDNTYDLSFHGIATDKEDVADFKLILSNCYFSKQISLDSLATNQTASLLISGCSAKNIPQTGVNNKWDVTSWCNEVRTD